LAGCKKNMMPALRKDAVQCRSPGGGWRISRGRGESGIITGGGGKSRSLDLVQITGGDTREKRTKTEMKREEMFPTRAAAKKVVNPSNSSHKPVASTSLFYGQA